MIFLRFNFSLKIIRQQMLRCVYDILLSTCFSFNRRCTYQTQAWSQFTFSRSRIYQILSLSTIVTFVLSLLCYIFLINIFLIGVSLNILYFLTQSRFVSSGLREKSGSDGSSLNLLSKEVLFLCLDEWHSRNLLLWEWKHLFWNIKSKYKAFFLWQFSKLFASTLQANFVVFHVII